MVVGLKIVLMVKMAIIHTEFNNVLTYICNCSQFSSPTFRFTKGILQLGYTSNLDHEPRERKTLNLHNGTCHNGSTGKDLWPALDCSCEGRIHICHEEYFIYYIVYRCPILCEHLLDVGICLPHLSLHISETYDIAPVIMTYLPR